MEEGNEEGSVRTENAEAHEGNSTYGAATVFRQEICCVRFPFGANSAAFFKFQEVTIEVKPREEK